jgi:hypothetical protein
MHAVLSISSRYFLTAQAAGGAFAALCPVVSEA